jgi:hypothetical protein
VAVAGSKRVMVHDIGGSSTESRPTSTECLSLVRGTTL